MTISLKCRVRSRSPTQHAGNVFLHLFQPSDPRQYHHEPHLAIVFGNRLQSRSLNQKWSDSETTYDRQIRGASIQQHPNDNDENDRDDGGECDDDVVLVRVHSACFTGETIGSARCDCGFQLMHAMEMMASSPNGGILVYLRQEGRGIGLEDKLKYGCSFQISV